MTTVTTFYPNPGEAKSALKTNGYVNPGFLGTCRESGSDLEISRDDNDDLGLITSLKIRKAASKGALVFRAIEDNNIYTDWVKEYLDQAPVRTIRDWACIL